MYLHQKTLWLSYAHGYQMRLHNSSEGQSSNFSFLRRIHGGKSAHGHSICNRPGTPTQRAYGLKPIGGRIGDGSNLALSNDQAVGGSKSGQNQTSQKGESQGGRTHKKRGKAYDCGGAALDGSPGIHGEANRQEKVDGFTSLST